MEKESRVKPKPAFSLTCYQCSAGDGVKSLRQAIKEGWREIEYDDGPSWNFLGFCPDCSGLFKRK